jgi:nicotinamide-nucleotide amidase
LHLLRLGVLARVMKVEVINTGTELLLGHVTNTHLGFLAQELFRLGLRIDRQVTVPDGAPIRQALLEARERGAELIVITGGLGPTSDDVTREIAAEVFGRTLVYDAEIWAQIEERFRRRNLVPNALNKGQAMVPSGARVLPNQHGTAPGLVIEEPGCAAVLLPGPPKELKPMWDEQVFPWLKTKCAGRRPLYEKVWRIVDVGESRAQEMIEADVRAIGDFEIGYCARSGEVDFRLITHDPELLEKAAAVVEEKFGTAICAGGTEPLEKIVVEAAKAAGRKIAVAESCTGGLIAHRLTNVPGSSAVFGFGWVTYANEAKVRELGVPAEMLAAHGAVSEEVARAMAEGARKASGADVAVAVTGIAGPEGGTKEKPVGLVWLAVAGAAGTRAESRQLSADRETFKFRVSQMALNMVRQALE